MRDKPIASLSLDLDNLWAYMRTHGDLGWDSFPSYLDRAVPRMLDALARRNLRITFFIVGQDAARAENREALQRIAAAGHEIGNHSFHHDPQLCLRSVKEIDAELAQAEDAIGGATGSKPTGFRGPGFCISRSLLEVLQRRGYHYDASTFPTFLGPLSRSYFFLTGKFSPDEKRKLRALYGPLSDGLRSLRPYQWALDEGHVLELPVSTMPLLRVPFHLSYVHFLGVRSGWVARTYFRRTLDLCRLTGLGPSVLLHPTDFLGADEVPALSYFPGMRIPRDIKLERMEGYLGDLVDRFTIISTGAHATRAAASGVLPLREARFPGRDPKGGLEGV